MATEVESVGVKRRRRIVPAVLALALVVGVSLPLVGLSSLRGLPDIGPPFDLAQSDSGPIPADENAFTFYRRAVAQLAPDEPRTMKGGYTSWAEVDESQLRWLEANRSALATWIEGTRRERARQRDVDLRSYNLDAKLPVTNKFYTMGRLVNLEAIRLLHEGDLAGSWVYLKAGLRATWHSGQDGLLLERLVGLSFYNSTAKQAIRWSDDPRVDAALIRRALADVLAQHGLKPASSAWLRNEFTAAINTLDDPTARDELLIAEDYPFEKRTSWVRLKFRLASSLSLLNREPERSRRVLKLIAANWLSACDLDEPARARRAVKFGSLVLFRPADGQMSPIPLGEIARWYESSRFARAFYPSLESIDRALARDERSRAALIVHLAERLYTFEQGKPPATIEALVGPYLDALPSGYVPPPAASETPR